MCADMDDMAKIGLPDASLAKPTIEPLGYKPSWSRPNVLITAYRPKSTNVRHSSWNESFGADAWCSLNCSISGSTFISETAELDDTSCALGVTHSWRDFEITKREAERQSTSRGASARVDAKAAEDMRITGRASGTDRKDE